MDTWLVVVMLLALMLVNAVLAGGEIALISVRQSRLRHLEGAAGGRARAAARLAGEPNRFLATIQLGITAAGFLASATAAITLAEPLVPALAVLGDMAEPVAVAAVSGALTFLTLVVGELTPKRLALQSPVRWALAVARPLELLARVSRPIVWALGAATDALVGLLGAGSAAETSELSPEELRDLAAGLGGVDQQQRTIVMGALEVHRRILRQVLVPRRKVFTVPVDWTPAQAREAMARAGHSRAPLVGPDGLDDVRGLVSLRELQLAGGSLLEAAGEPPNWPDTVRVTEALRRFRAERCQFALVSDEYGAVAGIVTLEDLVEEVVGEIYDETDVDVVAVQRQADGSLVLPGTFPVHDLPDLGLDVSGLATGDYTTVAGLVLASLGRLPDRPGDRVAVRGWILEVVAVDHRAITRVRARPPREQPPGA